MNEEHFDAIVVGSGFGGSVMAYRLAKAGFSVCLLERGKAYPPGSFPRSPYEMRKNFWTRARGSTASTTSGRSLGSTPSSPAASAAVLIP